MEKNKVFKKKAISPVVATALLLVVAVVAVVGFQTWFNNYQSGLNADVEKKSNVGAALTVELLEADCSIYVKNTGTEDIDLSEVKISWASNGTEVRSTTTSQRVNASTVNNLWGNSTACALNVGSEYNVVLVSSSGVFTFSHLAR